MAMIREQELGRCKKIADNTDTFTEAVKLEVGGIMVCTNPNTPILVYGHVCVKPIVVSGHREWGVYHIPCGALMASYTRKPASLLACVRFSEIIPEGITATELKKAIKTDFCLWRVLKTIGSNPYAPMVKWRELIVVKARKRVAPMARRRKVPTV